MNNLAQNASKAHEFLCRRHAVVSEYKKAGLHLKRVVTEQSQDFATGVSGSTDAILKVFDASHVLEHFHLLQLCMHTDPVPA